MLRVAAIGGLDEGSRSPEDLFRTARFKHEIEIVNVSFVILPGGFRLALSDRPGMLVVEIKAVFARDGRERFVERSFDQFSNDLAESVGRGLGQTPTSYPSTHKRPSQSGTLCLRFFHLIFRSRVF